MKVQEYINLYKTKVYLYDPEGKFHDTEYSLLIDEGMLKLKPKSAFSIGSWPGDYVYYEIKMYKRGLHTLEKIYKNEEEYWKKQKRKPKTNYKFEPDRPTIEFPVSCKIFGIDDASYSKFYATIEEAVEDMKLILVCQPIDLWNDLINDKWIFTN